MGEEKINSNYEKFLGANTKYGIFNEEFINNFGEILKVKESKLEFYNYEGGLVYLALTMTKHATTINQTLPKSMRKEGEAIVRMSFLTALTFMGDVEGRDGKLEYLYQLMKSCSDISSDEYHYIHSLQSQTGMLFYILSSAITMAMAEDEFRRNKASEPQAIEPTNN
jgi:hypothetical protein